VPLYNCNRVLEMWEEREQFTVGLEFYTHDRVKGKAVPLQA